MVQYLKPLSLFLWIAPHLLLVVAGVLLCKRGLHRTFPFFFLYLCYEVVEFAILFTISQIHMGKGYVTVFLITWVGSAALRFGVIHEVLNKVFDRETGVDALSRAAVRWVTASLLIGVVILSLLGSGQTAGTLIAEASVVGRGVAIIQCGLVVFLIVFSNLLGISFQSFAFGIALGFGIYACADLAYFAIRTGDPSLAMVRVLNLLPTGSYNIAVFIWIRYLLVPEKQVVQPLQPLPTPSDLNRWSAEIDRFLQ